MLETTDLFTAINVIHTVRSKLPKKSCGGAFNERPQVKFASMKSWAVSTLQTK